MARFTGTLPMAGEVSSWPDRPSSGAVDAHGLSSWVPQVMTRWPIPAPSRGGTFTGVPVLEPYGAPCCAKVAGGVRFSPYLPDLRSIARMEPAGLLAEPGRRWAESGRADTNHRRSLSPRSSEAK